MEFVFNLVLVLHFVGLALLLGAFLVQIRDPEKTVTRWMWDGALTQLLTGLIMVGLIEGGALGDDEKGDLNHVKIGIKLLVVIVIAVLAFIGKRKPAPQVGLWATIGLLTLVNVIVAVFV
ncbi:MAG: hypothetical protein GC156_05630 [Actinomycetales bacterium]|nr:hypothetical protein [Actinomycetales bacterium]